MRIRTIVAWVLDQNSSKFAIIYVYFSEKKFPTDAEVANNFLIKNLLLPLSRPDPASNRRHKNGHSVLLFN